MGAELTTPEVFGAREWAITHAAQEAIRSGQNPTLALFQILDEIGLPNSDIWGARRYARSMINELKSDETDKAAEIATWEAVRDACTEAIRVTGVVIRGHKRDDPEPTVANHVPRPIRVVWLVDISGKRWARYTEVAAVPPLPCTIQLPDPKEGGRRLFAFKIVSYQSQAFGSFGSEAWDVWAFMEPAPGFDTVTAKVLEQSEFVVFAPSPSR